MRMTRLRRIRDEEWLGPQSSLLIYNSACFAQPAALLGVVWDRGVVVVVGIVVWVVAVVFAVADVVVVVVVVVAIAVGGDDVVCWC